MSRKYGIVGLVTIVLLVTTLSRGALTAAHFEEDSLLIGPYIDEVRFESGFDLQDLLDGLIDLHVGYVGPFYSDVIDQYRADPEVCVSHALRNLLYLVEFNCKKYPYNISEFRRAIAFALNKTNFVSECLGGFGIAHDSVVPQANRWCVEEEFGWHYYDSEAEIGNLMLDEAGFSINATSGYRLLPNGSLLEVVVYYTYTAPSSANLPDEVLSALDSLHIEARKEHVESEDLSALMDNHGDYDIICHLSVAHETDHDVEWLGYEYWSEYADVFGQNPTNFRNGSYDDWREQLLYTTSFEDVYQASLEMQRILHHNVPTIVVAQPRYVSAYRIDQFTGQVSDLREHSSGQWTLRKMHRLSGIMGGTAKVAYEGGPNSFNIFLADSDLSTRILRNLWPSLYEPGPDLTPVPDLAQNILIETHSSNPSIMEGKVRFTLDIVQNATWSDGTPLTAEDVVFTFAYIVESGVYGNPAIAELNDLTGVYTPSPYRVVFEFSSESYWHMYKFVFQQIIPMHIFNDETGIGYEGWSSWDPIFNESAPLVTCGPFIFNDFVEHQFYSLVRNPSYHYAKTAESTTTTTSSTTTTTSTTGMIDGILPMVILFGVPFGGIIVVYVLAVRFHVGRRSAAS